MPAAAIAAAAWSCVEKMLQVAQRTCAPSAVSVSISHVERTGDPRALQRLRCAEFLAQRHQARHLGLGDLDFLAAESGEFDVLDDVIVLVEHGSHGCISSR
jgi:hypothetical protein